MPCKTIRTWNPLACATDGQSLPDSALQERIKNFSVYIMAMILFLR